MKITAPLPPNLASGRMHWRVKLNKKKTYWETLDLLRAAKAIPEPNLSEKGGDFSDNPVLITATLYLYSNMDDDNAMHRLKYLLDWLVNNKYLRNDTRADIKWAGLPEQVIDRKNQRVEVELVPLTGGEK